MFAAALYVGTLPTEAAPAWPLAPVGQARHAHAKFFAVPMRQRKLVISLPGGDNTSNWKLVSADIRAYTSMGDRGQFLCALMPGHGFKRLIDVADQVCKHGIGSLPTPRRNCAPSSRRWKRCPIGWTWRWSRTELVLSGLCAVPGAYSCQRDAICSGRGTLPSGVSLSATPGSAVESCRSSSSSLIPARSAIDLIVCGPIALPQESSAAIGLF